MTFAQIASYSHFVIAVGVNGCASLPVFIAHFHLKAFTRTSFQGIAGRHGFCLGGMTAQTAQPRRIVANRLMAANESL